MSPLLLHLAPLVSTYGYIVLFLVAVVEGPVVGIVAGAIAASNEFNIYSVFFTLFVADIVGDVLYYLLGRWSNSESLKRIANRLGITNARIEPLEAKFKQSDWKLLLFGKTQAWGSVILYLSGTLRMSFWRFLFWNVVGTIPKVLLFEFVGYFFGQTIALSQHYLDIISIATLALSVVLLGGYWYFERYISKRFKD